MKKIIFFISILAFSCQDAVTENVSLVMLEAGQNTSLRGLSVVDDSVAWVSGSNGWVGSTQNRGQNWRWQQVLGFEDMDFRDIEAFSASEAILLSAGSPLVILKTTDGGQSWLEMHRDDRPDIFFDGMDITADGRGLAYGDPIDGYFQLLRTTDYGVTWQDISNETQLIAAEGEAGFAASGTGIRVLERGDVFIATGGHVSNLLHSSDFGATWAVYSTPMLQGSPSRGIFSIAFHNQKEGVAVGGDYRVDILRENAVWLTVDGGQSWQKPKSGTRGYRSTVEYIDSHGKQILAAGTSGVDYTKDGGSIWQAVSDESFHVVRRSKEKSSNWVLLAGAGGRIATLEKQN